jgi:ubiquinone/menaquinone biosynthesis C-methylase UbiE
MTSLTFAGEMARLQHAVAQCHDLVVRRTVVLQTLAPRTGERLLEIGCGGGFYAIEAGRFVGPSGRVSAVDISADQVDAARARCAELPWVECRVVGATDLPYPDAEFDAVYGNHVLEYIADLDQTLAELRRLLRPGGRLVFVATIWSWLIWHSADPARMRRLLAAWDAQAPYPDLPAILLAHLRQAGLQPLRQTPILVLNTSYNANSYSYWLARLLTPFVTSRQAVDEAEAAAWLAEFDDLERRGEYFFSATPVLTEAVRDAKPPRTAATADAPRPRWPAMGPIAGTARTERAGRVPAPGGTRHLASARDDHPLIRRPSA